LIKDVDKTLSDLEERLKFFKDIGADFFLRKEQLPLPELSKEPQPDSRDIAAIHQEILSCRKCPLALTRTQAVPGEGNFRAELMFVGEGPGHDEDVQGRPFVGRAGQLLTKIIQAMKYDRSEVFITNVVKCRPPENRIPRREEVECCTPYLVEQIKYIQPKAIVTLGKVAADFFIPKTLGGMTSVRGIFSEWNGIPVMPTFHPSYLVRNEGNRELRKMVWDDMQKVMALLGIK
jgi:DNA polymerase